MLYPNLASNDLKTTDKYRIRINFACFFVLFVFVFNEAVRGMVNEKLGWVNIPFLVASFLYYVISLKKGNIRPIVSFILIFFTVIVLINTFFLHKNFTYYAMSSANLFAPLLLLSVKISHKQALLGLKTFLTVFNPLIIVLLIIGVIDYITNSYIQLYLARTIFNGTNLGDLINQENSWGIYRYYSFIGHPLQTAKYFLIFYIMNSIYGRYEKKLLPQLFISAITIIGLIISGSKTALLLGLILVIFFSGLKKYRLVYFLSILLSLMFFFNTSLFQENLKIRFMQGIESGDITSGRNVLIETWLNSDIERPSLLLGGGADYSREVVERLNGQIHNFEYPLIMLAYDYGVLGTLIIYVILFAYPIIQFLKNKKYYILSLFLILAFMVNTNNGLASLGSDSLAGLCFIIFLLINLEKELRKPTETNMNEKKRIKVTW